MRLRTDNVGNVCIFATVKAFFGVFFNTYTNSEFVLLVANVVMLIHDGSFVSGYKSLESYSTGEIFGCVFN